MVVHFCLLLVWLQIGRHSVRLSLHTCIYSVLILPFSCSDIPTVGPYIQKPFKIALEKQKEKLHRKPGQDATTTSVSDFLGMLSIFYGKTGFWWEFKYIVERAFLMEIFRKIWNTIREIPLLSFLSENWTALFAFSLYTRLYNYKL